jgi:hypothetical protein
MKYVAILYSLVNPVSSVLTSKGCGTAESIFGISKERSIVLVPYFRTKFWKNV